MIWNGFWTLKKVWLIFFAKNLKKILTDEIDEIILSPSEVRMDDSIYMNFHIVAKNNLDRG